MRKFLYSVLGTITGIWISVIVGTILLVVTIAVLSADEVINIDENTVLKITLQGRSCDRATPINPMDKLTGNINDQFPINSVISAINQAKEDNRIPGILIECNGLSIGAAQAQAIRIALAKFRDAGKWVIAYGDTYTQAEYFIATAADCIYINTIGMIDIHGLSATTLYFKDLLDKVGIKAQVVKVGTYKSAVEPFTLNKMSDANRLQQEHFLNQIWGAMQTTIADCRATTPDSVNMWADSYTFAQSPQWYKEHNLIDSVMYRHQLDDYIADLTNVNKATCIEYSEYLNDVKLNTFSKNKGIKIAVLYAEGDITESDKDGIASDRIVPEILNIAENEDIDGLILRVNSGGGSAFASEQIWEAFEQYKSISGKPFYVSMSNMAASGGYYISCGADKIFAEPYTLTGSIGIFGIIPEAESLLSDKLGINTYTVSTNSGSLPDFYKPMTPGQKNAMQKYVDNGYDLFITRCAEGRCMPVEKLAELAQGRVWDGISAYQNGLIDELGGLDDAIETMTEYYGTTEYTLIEYPEIKPNFWDLFIDFTSTEVSSAKLQNYLGDSMVFYNAINSFRNLSPLQCRMDYIIIK